ncbi:MULTISPECIES: DNA-processing protein DprA [unclassified Marinobacter]|uniref:DNA-processing protein DprA n=1 Tax=unclassified Marinobacter TaxID=83889 RepID=UPI0026E16E9A|nr:MULTISPECIES: DNA-processing protein DprA [unclassified Marinobacter]MDO6441823.1 DNA-processing protein DprA [Marinobacter sp. 2_MG-2023]MDO6824792.1 DNA-processing protein DprA [Marinobacter sp. 1_MG-2023]
MFSSPSAQWLFLTCLPKFGRARRRAMLATTPDLTDLLTRNPATLRAQGLHAETVAAILAWQQQNEADSSVKTVQQILVACERHGIGTVNWQHPDYPDVLRHIHDAPLVLYTRGDPRLLCYEQIGIIGSRNATPAGLDHARRFAAELSNRNLLVTSGLALGVDGAAHAGALDAGYATIAVIGCGLDRIYPNQHRRLGDRVIEHGLMVSEYPPGTPARAAHFPQRNRIISGLSRGILVVEAGLKSGSLITARMALEQGREVFAIPGSIHSPVARGCHHLIKQGARLVDTVDDILEELGACWSLPAVRELPEQSGIQPGAESRDAGPLAALDNREIAVFEALGYDPQSTDALCSATGLPADQLVQSLLLLELEGLVSSAPGGFQKIA